MTRAKALDWLQGYYGTPVRWEAANDLLVRWIHVRSPRSGSTFRSVNIENRDLIDLVRYLHAYEIFLY